MIKNKKGLNSDLMQPAQTNILLQREYDPEVLYNKMRHFIDNNKIYGANVKLVVWLLYHTGARISEVLRLKSSDITKDWFVKINAVKGSRSRIVKVEKPPFKVIINYNLNYYLFPELSRFYMYRVCRSYGLQLQVAGQRKKSVTHAFRHNYASQLLKLQTSENLAGRSLGHKSNNSILSYAKKKGE